ncbi:MAG: ABC transporter ATP-binding protein [Rhodospirillaceae bacterium]|nr:ABC transporter ATP-binding protein [Rhodospirillaceae bacterium]
MAVALRDRVEPAQRPVLEVRDLVMGGAEANAVDRVSFSIGRSEIFTVLGPSPAGKSALLRGVAGHEAPRAGSVIVDGETIANDRGGPAEAVASVFFVGQNWPRETVAATVAMPLEDRGLTTVQVRAKVSEAMAKMGVGQLANRAMGQLSTGEQHRVALAQALVRDAKLLVLDEPFVQLDGDLREELRADLRSLGKAALCATQDQESALALSGRIAIMRAGRIVETGAPLDLYLRPQHPFTASFLGHAVLLEGRRVSGIGEGVLVETDIGSFVAAQAAHDGERGLLMIRPEFVEMVGRDVSAANLVSGTVRGAVFCGRYVAYSVEVGRRLLRVERPATRLYTPGEPVRLRLPAERCGFLPREEA